MATTTIRAEHARRGTIRKLRKNLRRIQARTALHTAVLRHKSRGELRRAETLYSQDRDGLIAHAAAQTARIAELETAGGAWRAFWAAVGRAIRRAA